jgi:starvation-inducible DNA-binding protein
MIIAKDGNSTTLALALTTCLANATVMYHRTHGFHWNVVGADFPEWHDKFGEIYEDVYGSIDPLGENIRKIGAFPPFRLQELSARATVADGGVMGNDPQTLIADLLATNRGVLDCLNDAFQIANSVNQQGIANFLAERIDAHQKWNWQLSASIA